MNKKYIYIATLALSIIIPAVSFAESLSGLKDLIKAFQDVLGLAIPVVFGFALVYFFWGVAQFILNAGEEKARDEGKQRMLWGIVGLFVIISIYGILAFVGNTLNIKPGGTFTPGSGATGGNGTNCTDEQKAMEVC